MKTVITGSRTLTKIEHAAWIEKRLLEYFKPGVAMINGGCPKGVDQICKRWALENDRELILMPADWNKYGRGAGFRRNGEMSEIADNCLAFWDGESKGTRHMIDICLNMGMSVHVFTWRLNK